MLDGEPIYEDHPVVFNAKKFGHSIAADVRRPLYWDLFSGAFGHTYGHHSVWQMWTPERRARSTTRCCRGPRPSSSPAPLQMQHARALLESRPFLTRIPDPTSIVAADRCRPACRAPAATHFVATRDADGSYAMVYAPVGRPFAVRMDKSPADASQGLVVQSARPARRPRSALSPMAANVSSRRPTGEMLDWVLVLDDASKNYAAPGSRMR